MKASGGMHDAPAATPAVELTMAMRVLWEEHITYTRNYIISALAGLPDTDAVAQRLLRNQDDIGNAIKPSYGDAAGNKLSALLHEHIAIATEVVGRLTKDWAGDIKSYDDGHAHMLMFADMLTDGITKQFPAKFQK